MSSELGQPPIWHLSKPKAKRLRDRPGVTNLVKKTLGNRVHLLVLMYLLPQVRFEE